MKIIRIEEEKVNEMSCIVEEMEKLAREARHCLNEMCSETMGERNSYGYGDREMYGDRWQAYGDRDSSMGMREFEGRYGFGERRGGYRRR